VHSVAFHMMDGQYEESLAVIAVCRCHRVYASDEGEASPAMISMKDELMFPSLDMVLLHVMRRE